MRVVLKAHGLLNFYLKTERSNRLARPVSKLTNIIKCVS